MGDRGHAAHDTGRRVPRRGVAGAGAIEDPLDPRLRVARFLDALAHAFRHRRGIDCVRVAQAGDPDVLDRVRHGRRIPSGGAAATEGARAGASSAGPGVLWF